jgi:hypothetical protein
MGTESGARVAGGAFCRPLGEEKSSTPKHAYWNGAVKMGGPSLADIRTKRTAADLAATRELLCGMPRGRELEQLIDEVETAEDKQPRRKARTGIRIESPRTRPARRSLPCRGTSGGAVCLTDGFPWRLPAPSVWRNHVENGLSPSFNFFSVWTVRGRATSVEECTKKPRRNAAFTLRACRYRGPRRQPSRLCCSSRLHRWSSNAPCRPYLVGS